MAAAIYRTLRKKNEATEGHMTSDNAAWIRLLRYLIYDSFKLQGILHFWTDLLICGRLFIVSSTGQCRALVSVRK
jgi:hypothetical protein